VQWDFDELVHVILRQRAIYDGHAHFVADLQDDSAAPDAILRRSEHCREVQIVALLSTLPNLRRRQCRNKLGK